MKTTTATETKPSIALMTDEAVEALRVSVFHRADELTAIAKRLSAAGATHREIALWWQGAYEWHKLVYDLLPEYTRERDLSSDDTICGRLEKLVRDVKSIITFAR